MNSDVQLFNVFPNWVAVNMLDLKKLNIVAKKFTKRFESNLKTSLIEGDTLLDINSMNYLNIELTKLLSHLLKNKYKSFGFDLVDLWINKYEDNYQSAHVHAGDFSFIIYYQIDKSHTVLDSPVKNLLEIGKVDKVFDMEYHLTLKQGSIIMFPSYLPHWVKPCSSGITIAGNIKMRELNE